MRPNQPRGSIIGRNQRRSTLHLHVYTGMMSCVRIGGGRPLWPGFCSRQISPSLSFHPPLPSSFFSSLFSFSPPRYSRQRVTLLLFRRYLDWLAFQRTTLFPATTEIPVAVSFPPVYHLRENYFPRYKRDNTARHFQTNTWTRIIGIRRNRFAIQGGRRGR